MQHWWRDSARWGAGAGVVLCLCLAAPPRGRATGPRRPGARVTVFGLDSAGGLEASAFLLYSSRDIQLPPRYALETCAQPIVATARLSRGPIRGLRLELHTGCAGPVPLSAGGCPRARVTVTLESGHEVSSSEGEVVVEGIRAEPGGMVCGRFSMTAIDNNEPLTLRGTFSIPIR